MAYASLFLSNFIPLSPIKCTKTLTSVHPYFPSIQLKNNNLRERGLALPRVASITYPPNKEDYLESDFSGHDGVTFEDISDSRVVKLGLENGSVATLMLPSGLITSYKVPMWHGGVVELLQTSVSKGEDGESVIQGGVSLAFNCEGDGGVSWSPSSWVLGDVRGSPQESILVELVSRNSQDMIEAKYILTLHQDLLSSELVFLNSRSSSLRVMGSVISHLTVSTPEATYAVGLEGSNFYGRPPFLSNFSIVPPESTEGKNSGELWSPFAELLSTWGAGNSGGDAKRGEREEETEGEENDNYKHLTEKMSMIYTSAPRNFTIIDRGKRNSVVVGRDGFNELYMFSPGSTHEWYGKYAYICVGQAALLEPVIVGPQSEWRGLQRLRNPNL